MIKVNHRRVTYHMTKDSFSLQSAFQTLINAELTFSLTNWVARLDKWKSVFQPAAHLISSKSEGETRLMLPLTFEEWHRVITHRLVY